MRITLRLANTPNVSESFTVLGPRTITVGRDHYADWKVPIHDPYVSRHHFQLNVTPPTVQLQHLGRRNPTLVNKRITSKIDLKDGDEIRVGLTLIQIRIESTESLADEEPTMELVLAWQEQQWHTGMRQIVEATLKRWPMLINDQERMMDVIYHEFMLRRRNNDRILPNEYETRFPQLVDLLRDQFFCHELFAETPHVV